MLQLLLFYCSVELSCKRYAKNRFVCIRKSIRASQSLVRYNRNELTVELNVRWRFEEEFA
jgi:hypothetical protein